VMTCAVVFSGEWRGETPPRRACNLSVELFESQVEAVPDAIAIATGQTLSQLSRAEHPRRSTRASLDRPGVCAEGVVGLWPTALLRCLVGLLGILKAGGAYLPLDPTYPVLRAAVDDARRTADAAREKFCVAGGRRID